MRFPRKLLAFAALAAAATAHAQNAPKHEFGIDLVIASVKPTSDDVPSALIPRTLLATTPLDVRIGFLAQGRMMLETRFGFSYVKVGDTDDNEGGSALEFTPGLNLMFRLGKGSGLHNQMGPYFTVGGTFDISKSSGEETTKQPGINVGLGTRIAWGSAAFRPELIFAKVFETDDSFGATVFGVRLGLSFFH